MILRIIFAVSCGVALILMCANAEGRSDDSSKKPKTSESTIVKKANASPAGELPPPETSDESTNSSGSAVPQSSPDSEWEFSIAPYFFLPGLDSTVGVFGQRAEARGSPRDTLRHLDFAAMGAFEARKGNWSILGDAMYISLSGKSITLSAFFPDVEIGLKQTIIEPAIAYRVVRGERGSIDLLSGVRFWHVKPRLTFQRSPLPLMDVEVSENWADPIIGARGVANISPRIFLTGRFDVGGFGAGADFTGQAFGGVGLQVKPRIALIGGYRYLQVDYFEEGFIFRMQMRGITLGAKFRL